MRELNEILGAPPDRDRMPGSILPGGNPFKGPAVEEGGPGWGGPSSPPTLGATLSRSRGSS